MRRILLLGLFVAVVNGQSKVTVTRSVCGSDYSLSGNWLDDKMTLEYDGSPLPQGCTVTISTSQPHALLQCFDAEFDGRWKPMAYKVEYYNGIVDNYPDKTIDSVLDTVEWCVVSSKVSVVFVSGGGSSVQPEIEIKIKVKDNDLSNNIFVAAKTISVAIIGIIVGVVVLVIVACVVVVCCCLKRQRNRQGQVVRQPQTTMARLQPRYGKIGQPYNQGGYQMVPSNAPPPAGYQGYPPPSQAGYPPQQGYPPPSQAGYQPQQGYPQAPPAGYQPGPTGYPPAGYQQSGYPPATQGGYPPGPTGYPQEPEKGYAGNQQSVSPSAPPPPYTS